VTGADRRRLDKLARYIAASAIAFGSGETFEAIYYQAIEEDDEGLGDIADLWYTLAAVVERQAGSLLKNNFGYDYKPEELSLTERWTLAPRREKRRT